MYLGSDAFALAPFTNRVSYLADGDWAIMPRRGGNLRSISALVERLVKTVDASAAMVDKAIIATHGEGNSRTARRAVAHFRSIY